MSAVGQVEQQARAALAWYPKGWRVANGDALVGTLMDAADAGERTTLTRRERLDLARSGLSARLSVALPQAIRDRASLVATGLGGVLAIWILVTSELVPESAMWRDGLTDALGAPIGVGPFDSTSSIWMVIWIAVLATAFVGRRKVQLIGWALVLLGGLVVLLPRELSINLLGLSRGQAVFLLAIAAIGASGNPARLRRWRAALTFGVVVSAIVVVSIHLLYAPHGWDGMGGSMLAQIHPFTMFGAFAIAVAAALIARSGLWAWALVFASAPWWLMTIAIVDLGPTFTLALLGIPVLMIAFGLGMRRARRAGGPDGGIA